MTNQGVIGKYSLVCGFVTITISFLKHDVNDFWRSDYLIVFVVGGLDWR